MTDQQFETVVEKTGKRIFIVLPFHPDRVWGSKTRHHVCGKIENSTVRGPVQSDGDRHIVLLGDAWRRDTGIEVGQKVHVSLAPEGPQQETLAPDIAAAFDDEPQAKAFFDGLATFYRKNYLRWINGARQADTRAGRIHEMIGRLKAGKKQR